MYSTHAEINFMKKIKNWKNLPKKFNILVIKISKTGKICNSKPCKNCISYFKNSRLPIKNIYYSIDENTILCENINKITNNYVTSGERRKKK